MALIQDTENEHDDGTPQELPTGDEHGQYDRQAILESLINPNYAEDRKEQIEETERFISEGFNVDEAKQLLETLKATPPGPVLDPSEPRGLTQAVYCRIEELKMILADGEDEQDRSNIEAVLTAYRQGTLQVVPGKVSYWIDGIMKRGLGDELPLDELTEQIAKLKEGSPDGNLWIEDTQTYYEMADTAVYSPGNNFGQHSYDVTVRSLNGTATTTFSVLDDTGATYLNLTRRDCVQLGIDVNYGFWCGKVRLRTANGPVTRRRLEVEVRLLGPTGVPVGDFVRTLAVIHRGMHQWNARRLSGTFVRRSLFTGTAPDGNMNLVVSNKKTGMISHIPAV